MEIQPLLGFLSGIRFALRPWRGRRGPEPTATAWGDGWFAVVAPAGTPASIVVRLNQEIAHFLADPGVRQRILGFGLAPSGSGSPEATTEFIRADQERWRGLVKELGIEPQ
jgi:tripartite-type tricarboxylate transporter receptor subunit TctC